MRGAFGYRRRVKRCRRMSAIFADIIAASRRRHLSASLYGHEAVPSRIGGLQPTYVYRRLKYIEFLAALSGVMKKKRC